MTTNFASGTLVVLGAVITVLGFILAGELTMVIVGLVAIFAGGLLGARERRPA